MLNKLKASQLKSNEPGRRYDGGGLQLYVRVSLKGAVRKQWVYRFTWAGKRVDMGLGSLAELSLLQARELREQYAADVKAGHDPRQKRDQERHAATAAAIAAATTPTVEKIVREAYEAIQADLKGGGSNGDWLGPMRLYVFPAMGDVAITDVTQHVIKEALSPVWKTKHPSAVKAINRLGIAMRHAAAMDLDVDLQAVSKAKLLLGAVDHKEKNHAALPYTIAPSFYQYLGEDRPTLKLLKLLMLTGVRSAEIRLGRIEAIDWAANTLTSSEDIVKGTKKRVKENRIALTDEAMRLLRSACGARIRGYIFLNNQNKPFSDNAVSKLLRESKWLQDQNIKATPHGMRSTMKTYIREQHPEVPPEVVEMVLSHKTESDVGAAYMRSDLLEQQRAVLNRWNRYLTGDNKPINDIYSRGAGG